MTSTVSEYNQAHGFGFDARESRLRKAAAWIRSLRPGKLLDVGCQKGEWAAQWTKSGWDVSGVDINPADVAAAAGKIKARVCDLNREPLPFPGGEFDLIFAGEIIEHLVDTDGFLRELHRCLRPGGHALLTTPNLASFENRIKLLLGKYPRWLDYRLAECGHVRAYTPAVLKRQLRELGLPVVRQTGNWVPFLPQSWIDDVRCPWLAVTGTWFPNLSTNLIVLARKNS